MRFLVDIRPITVPPVMIIIELLAITRWEMGSMDSSQIGFNPHANMNIRDILY